MYIEKKLELIKQVGEEIITEQELRKLFETKKHSIAYDGFEPSGVAHLGSGLLRAINLQDLLKAGIKFKLLIADWFAWINNKFGGDLEKIQNAGKYLIEVWKACGVNLKKVDVCWTSEVVKDPEYWKLVVEVSRLTTIDRMKRASTIMGRKEDEMQYTAQLFYPAMQTADPFYLGVDICQLGIDQRKCGILSREVGPRLNLWKPVCIYHHLLIGLQKPVKMGGFEKNKELDLEISSKMAKSIPKTCIFVHDSDKKIKEKIKAAYCPEKVVVNNPIMEICEYIVFRKFKKLKIERPLKFGGGLEVKNYEELERLFKKGEIHPLDLKNSVAEVLDKLIKPVRKHFKKNKKAKELFETVKKAEVTR
jgi:tyrosyl-tRNA synthetase